MPENPIDDVVRQLTAIIDRAEAAGSRLGYFAALYRRVTATVLAEIASFEDPARMTRLDVVFATRYLDALATFQAGGQPSKSWGVAFQAASDPEPIVLQHLLLGMNAHINLDLGIAAATVAPGAALPALHDDFLKINALLASLVQTVIAELSQVSPLLGLLGQLVGTDDDLQIANFGLDTARDWAWSFAEILPPLAPAQQASKIATVDRLVAGFAQALWHPEPVLAALYKVIRSAETDSVAQIIEVLAAPSAAAAAAAAAGRQG
jgi:hypothetical protein